MKIVYQDDDIVGVMVHRQEAELIAAVFGRLPPAELMRVAGYSSTAEFVPCDTYAKLFNVPRDNISTYNDVTTDLIQVIYDTTQEACGKGLKADLRGKKI